jgi:predicted aspartyl protease
MSPRTTLVLAIKGITTHFIFLSKRGKADKCALVDSGATKNFMDHSMIKRLGIGTRKLPVPRRIFNVDGTENIAG